MARDVVTVTLSRQTAEELVNAHVIALGATSLQKKDGKKKDGGGKKYPPVKGKDGGGKKYPTGK